MSIGFGIFLIVVGAVLAFALNVQVDWVDLDLVGYLLMGAGVIITIIGIALLARRRTTRSVSSTTVDPQSGQRVTRQESSAPDDTVV